MTIHYKSLGAGSVGGIYFNKEDGSLGRTIVSRLLIPGLVVGEKLLVTAETTTSLNADPAFSYIGWGHNTFTASDIWISRTQQGWWFDPTNCIQLCGQSGEDIHPATATEDMQPYKHHTKTTTHEIVAGQEGDWWVIHDVWASCTFATGNSVAKNEYLNLFSNQTAMSVLRFPT